MSDHSIQLLMLIVQACAFGGLIWYCIETFKLRRTAQDQITESQKMIKATTDQVEGLSKPCLMLVSQLRDQTDAILGMGGVVGSTEAAGYDGNFVVENVGNGPALNVKYRFIAIGEYAYNFPEHDIRYVQNILTGQKVQMVEPRNAFNGEWLLIFHYDSIGGRRYQSKITMNSYVLTEFEFGSAESSIPEPEPLAART